MLGHGLKLFVSDRDLRWAGREATAADVKFITRAALRIFKVVPEQHPMRRDEPDNVTIEVERDEALRGYEITVMAPFLTFGYANPLPLRLEPKIEAVEHDGRHFSITGELVPVPDEARS